MNRPAPGDLPPARHHRQAGAGLVEVLVALFLLTAVATAFIAAMAGFQAGSARAQLLRGAVSCTAHVVERVRGGLMTVPEQGASGSCADAGWPNLGYRVTPFQVTEMGGEARWQAMTVSVYPALQVGRPEAVIYQLTTSVWVRSN